MLTFTYAELFALASMPALLLLWLGTPWRSVAMALGALLIPALVVGAVNLPPEHQLNATRGRSASRPCPRRPDVTWSRC